MHKYFALTIFFIVFRECIEAIIIISTLLSLLKQSLGQPGQDRRIHCRIVKQLWAGVVAGIVLSIIIGVTFAVIFHRFGKNLWAKAEDLWEGIFYAIATFFITIMGLGFLRLNKSQEKWRVKISKALVDQKRKKGVWAWLGSWAARYVMFVVPLMTVVREGVECVVFVGGVSLGSPASSYPLPFLAGLLAAVAIGFLMYKGGNRLSIQIFLIISTSFLYLIAAGMLSKSVWSLQYQHFQKKVGSDVAEAGDGPGSYDVRQTVWHVDCCNPETGRGWDVFNALLGWQNTATYGSVIVYNVYWLFIILLVGSLLYEERWGPLPLKTKILGFLLRVPVLKIYVRHKMKANIGHQEADDLVRQVQEHLREVHEGQQGSEDIFVAQESVGGEMFEMEERRGVTLTEESVARI
ncbi:high-affinity iron transporter [Mollisia scopiformis]|uniref:High-affinity iron transporter n=1 Tax=Mollisia scopiformis TaxID=149040 RepID=A0A194WX86_MOLSC|nr:high-affinity iron transporter [Mollisia scopiformis]KUJ12596.1 high-affinity iron transporter [Mollisia scopiformis]